MMITQQVFFDRLAEVAKPRPEGSNQSLDCVLEILKQSWGIEDCQLEDFNHRMHTYSRSVDFPHLVKFPGYPYFFDLSPEARLAIADEKLTDNWVYDRPTKTLILNLTQGYHTALLTQLYTVHTGDRVTACAYERAERYVAEGFGFYRSSASNYAEKGKEVTLDAQEKTIFKSAKFYRE